MRLLFWRNPLNIKVSLHIFYLVHLNLVKIILKLFCTTVVWLSCSIQLLQFDNSWHRQMMWVHLWHFRVHLWHFQVGIGTLWYHENKAWTNVTTFLLETHIQLESVIFVLLIYKDGLVGHVWHFIKKHFWQLFHSNISSAQSLCCTIFFPYSLCYAFSLYTHISFDMPL